MVKDAPSGKSIKEFFPHEYDFILDKKNREWRNIAIIPWIDEARINEVLTSEVETSLTPEEKKRNTFGTALLFFFDPKSTDNPIFSSPFLPSHTSTVNHCKCQPFVAPPIPPRAQSVKEEEKDKEEKKEDKEEKKEDGKKKELFTPLPHPQWKSKMLPAGCMPTTMTLPFQCRLEKAQVQIVGGASRNLSVILKPVLAGELAGFAKNPDEIVKRFMGTFISNHEYSKLFSREVLFCRMAILG
jgi:hypothetical protein